MLTWIRQRAAFITGWVDWAAMYPLIRTRSGREVIVSFLYAESKRRPLLFKELWLMFAKLASRDEAEEALRQAQADGPEARPLNRVPDSEAPLRRVGLDLVTPDGQRVPHPVELPESSGPDPLFAAPPRQEPRTPANGVREPSAPHDALRFSPSQDGPRRKR